MLQTLFGIDPWRAVYFVLMFLVVLAAFGGFVYLLRRFAGGALGGAIGPRGRQPRLAAIESTTIDGRRTLWLIRRDNVEHLIMTGGPTDIVIEPNIVRAVAAAPAREAAPARAAPTLADTLRAVPLADGGNWPLQPDTPPAPPQRAEPPMRAEAPPRPQRAATTPPAPPPPAAADEEAHEPEWSAREEPASEPEPARVEPRAEPPLRAEPPMRAEPLLRAVPDAEPAPQRAGRMQNPERLSGLAADLSRSFMDMDLPAQPRRGAEQRRPPPPPAQPVPSVQPLSEAEEQNLTEMAQRLESALQRPRQNPVAAAEPTTPPPAPPPAPPTLRAVELPRIEPVPRARAKPPRPEIVPGPIQKPAGKAAPTPITQPTTEKPALATLEQEMASLLGRSSSGKT
jgi:hypothetical protein